MNVKMKMEMKASPVAFVRTISERLLETTKRARTEKSQCSLWLVIESGDDDEEAESEEEGEKEGIRMFAILCSEKWLLPSLMLIAMSDNDRYTH